MNVKVKPAIIYWQFRNGKVGPLESLGITESTYGAWDRSLGALVIYPVR